MLPTRESSEQPGDDGWEPASVTEGGVDIGEPLATVVDWLTAIEQKIAAIEARLAALERRDGETGGPPR
jgi:hypothetical protein